MSEQSDLEREDGDAPWRGPARHVGEDGLLAYAAGALTPGAALVVATHLGACARCREDVALLERVGGLMLEAAPAEPMRAEAFGPAWADREVAPPGASAPRPQRRARPVGRWRWAGPGLQIATLDGAGAPDERVYMIKAAPGVRLPAHTHRGVERTVVIEGAFEDGGVHAVGDYAECALERRHQPVAMEQGCICLVATDGPLELSGVARLLQPFFGV